MMERASAEKRVETPASKIVLGLNCGGSDSFSGITANPALGVCCDLLAATRRHGGSGRDHRDLRRRASAGARRARNRQVAEKLLGFVAGYKSYLKRFGGSFDDNPSPGNKEGGLTNILEKSLGAVAKAGTSPLMDVVDYAERIASPGFVFMNTPGYDPVSLTGLAAGGVNLIAFTTGRGSAIGFPTIPVIKIASNSAIYRRMRDNMDVNAGRIADGDGTVAEVGREIFDLLLRVASGEKTCERTAGAQGIRAVADWSGAVMHDHRRSCTNRRQNLSGSAAYAKCGGRREPDSGDGLFARQCHAGAERRASAVAQPGAGRNLFGPGRARRDVPGR